MLQGRSSLLTVEVAEEVQLAEEQVLVAAVGQLVMVVPLEAGGVLRSKYKRSTTFSWLAVSFLLTHAQPHHHTSRSTTRLTWCHTLRMLWRGDLRTPGST